MSGWGSYSPIRSPATPEARIRVKRIFTGLQSVSFSEGTSHLEQVERIELSRTGWKPAMLPKHLTCKQDHVVLPYCFVESGGVEPLGARSERRALIL